MGTDRLLYVEGEEDQQFFASVFRKIGMDDMADLTERHRKIHCNPSGKGNAINSFGSVLAQLTPASDARIGLVVDADRHAANSGNGFAASLGAINTKLRSHSFEDLARSLSTTSGFFTQAADKPTVQVGVWVMPDNRSDGDLEHFAGSVVSADEAACFQYAASRAKEVGENKHGGPAFKFKAHHLSKAEVGTWLAWSDPPRKSLGAAVSKEWLNIAHPQFQNLINWLKKLYS